MTETSASTASTSTITRKEWFEDSSLEGEARIRVRLLKKGGKKKPMSLEKMMTRKVERITVPRTARVPLKKKMKKNFVQNVKQMVEV